MHFLMLYVLVLVLLALNRVGRLLLILLPVLARLVLADYIHRALIGPPLLPEGPGP